MRLLQCDNVGRLLYDDNGKVSLTSFMPYQKIPPYAILSHTWGPDNEEVIYKDLADGTGSAKGGFRKLDFCAHQTHRHNLKYFWVDSCCIDKTSSQELQESIASMFSWYRKAAQCFVYLTDVAAPSTPPEIDRMITGTFWEPEFCASRWFTRGWTLQELIAPASVKFFALDGTFLGDKQSLQKLVQEITGIATEALDGTRPLADFSVKERFKWAETRQTTREEDWAYCLIGIFEVSITLRYAEGKQNAIDRLNEAIHKVERRIANRKRAEREKAAQRLRRELHQHMRALHERNKRETIRFAVIAILVFSLLSIYLRHFDTRLKTPLTPKGHFIVPYAPEVGLVKRSYTLNQMKTEFGYNRWSSAPRAHKRLWLYGPSGAGKTQIALEYAHWLHKTHPEVSVFWVDASSAYSFRQSYSSIMEQCQDKGNGDPLWMGKKCLQRYDSGPWLMVINYADNENVFFDLSVITGAETAREKVELNASYIPESDDGAILVTTRNRVPDSTLTQNMRQIEIPRLDKREAFALLSAKLSSTKFRQAHLTSQARDISTLFQRLEYHSLAIATAAAFIREYAISVHEYIQRLDESAQENAILLSPESNIAGISPAVSTVMAETLWLTFAQIQSRYPIALDLLSFMSFLSRHRIPRALLLHYLHHKSNTFGPAPLENAISALKAFSLIVEDQSGSFHLQRLVQLFTQKWLANKGSLLDDRRHAISTVIERYDMIQSQAAACGAYVPHLQAILGLIDQVPDHNDTLRAVTIHHLGVCFHAQRSWKDTEVLLLQAAEIWEQGERSDYGNMLYSVGADKLATVYIHQGRLDEAEERSMQGIETASKLPETEHIKPPTLLPNLQVTLGTICSRQGQWDKGNKLLLGALQALTEELGEEHSQTLAAMCALASAYAQQDRHDNGAEPLWAKVFKIRSEALGEEDPETLESMHGLATSWWAMGRHKDAFDLMRRCGTTRLRVLGCPRQREQYRRIAFGSFCGATTDTGVVRPRNPFSPTFYHRAPLSASIEFLGPTRNSDIRLINVESLELEEFFGDDIPLYAILSHTWGKEEWYRSAEICYAYLEDVDGPLETTSRWRSCGLPAQLGTREAFASVMSTITGIDSYVLSNSDPEARPWETFSVAQRMAWLASRSTTRIEDMAYCMLGTFNIHMPLLYGEGSRAFLRLQEEIIKVSDDRTIFA
ncbi:heterokaryon incompatibility protein-domain-containing protein [Podospora didyma]|uniref:Heterokaryon incompatibility protein-domain-containing protein n=1 Tax=Podospora didyma TaxID=330526 RepID=A0AAE0K1X1_9PEZI|nr:heterokaryon incompatibility protein-domain-containing protein [Podospora didyma]